MNDSEELNSIVKLVLTCKDEDVTLLYKKFKGHKHVKKIVIEGMEFGYYSYRWKLADDESVTCQDLKDALVQLKPFCRDITKPYEGTNIKCEIMIINNGDPVPMHPFYSEDDIIKAMTSPEDKWAVWRAHNGASTQPQAFFWDDADSRDPIKTIVKKWRQKMSPKKLKSGKL